jgi:hypothetical protein
VLLHARHRPAVAGGGRPTRAREGEGEGEGGRAREAGRMASSGGEEVPRSRQARVGRRRMKRNSRSSASSRLRALLLLALRGRASPRRERLHDA